MKWIDRRPRLPRYAPASAPEVNGGLHIWFHRPRGRVQTELDFTQPWWGSKNQTSARFVNKRPLGLSNEAQPLTRVISV